MNRWMGAALVMCALAVGCGTREHCGAPAEVSYACEPLPAGSLRGCDEDPGEAFGMPAGLPGGDGVAPVGCEVTLPYCHPYYPDTPATCTCVERVGPDGNPNGEANWLCPL